MLRNLRETITDKIQQEHQMIEASCEGFPDDHDAVQAALERQLSRRQLSTGDSRRAVVREPTPVHNHVGRYCITSRVKMRRR